MARSLVVRIVEGLVAAAGRDNDAAIIFMNDLWSDPANRVQSTNEDHKVCIESVDQGPLGMSDIAVGACEAAEALPRRRMAKLILSL
jgi:hypothetical protein